MDTISRENNSMLPIGSLIVGVLGLLLGGYSAAITVDQDFVLSVGHQEKDLAAVAPLLCAERKRATTSEPRLSCLCRSPVNAGSARDPYRVTATARPGPRLARGAPRSAGSG